MTFVPSTAATSGAIAASAAAKHQRELQREEELMTKYGADEIEDWEFKIMRSASGKFKKPEFLSRICEEESKAGWEMLEKFDDHRVRFRRSTEHRNRDQNLEIDPYRTRLGMGPDQIGLLIAASILVGLGTLLGIVFYLTNVAK